MRPVRIVVSIQKRKKKKKKKKERKKTFMQFETLNNRLSEHLHALTDCKYNVHIQAHTMKW